MADDRSVASELSRDLSLFQITMMGLGMMIGAGVFVGIGISVKGAGPGGLLLTFALNGLIALFTAMSFAELSSAIPRAGGAYNFARIAFGRGASFLAGWMEWFASSLAGAFYAIVFAHFTLEFVNSVFQLGLSEQAKSILRRAIGLAAAGAFVYVNFRGASETGKAGVLFAGGQMLFVLAIAVVGVVTACVHPQRLANFKPFLHPDGWIKLLGTMGVIYVAFEGFEVIAQAGDETIDPKRNVPKAMLYSVIIVTVTYVAVGFACVVAVGDLGGKADLLAWFRQYKEIDGFSATVQQLIPGFGQFLVALAVIFSSTSALNATIYSATRASYALGRDGMLPPTFKGIHAKRKTPYGALGFTAVIVLLAAGFLDPKGGAATASIMFLFLFLAVNLCVIKIRLNMGDELEYGYIMPLFPLFPILAIVCQAALAWGIMRESEESRIAWLIGPGWIVVGLLVYLLYSRTRAPAGEHEVHVFEEQQAPAGDEYRIMVAVANPNNALEMVRNTYRLCGAKKARVELLHMVPVPGQVPLSDAHEYTHPGRESIMETMLYLAPMFPISTTLRYCRNVARGIVSAVRQKKADMLIMGWHGRPRARLFSIGSTVDPVIERVPCDVVILKRCGGDRRFRNVLVPVAGGPNSALALEIAGILADPDEGRITAFTVASPGWKFDPTAFVNLHVQRLHLPEQRIEVKSVRAAHVVPAILAEAADYDLVVLGATRQAVFRHFARRSVPETVAAMCEKPLVMVKASGGLRSWVKRWV